MELRKIRNPKGERKRGKEKNSRKRGAKGSLCLRCIRSLTKRPGLRTQPAARGDCRFRAKNSTTFCL